MGRAALASGLNLATELLYEQEQEKRKRRQRAAELAMEFDYDRKLKEYQAVLEGRGTYDPKTRQFIRVQPQVPGGLEPYEWTDPVTGVRYRSPRAIEGDLSPEEHRKLFEGPLGPIGAPGQPYPGVVSAAGRPALNQAIELGLRESPATRFTAPFPEMPQGSLASPQEFPLTLGGGGERRIRVRRKADGITGTIEESLFNSAEYDLL